jgi:hypothetical protein
MNTDKMSEENRFRTFGEILNVPGHSEDIYPCLFIRVHPWFEFF